MADELDALTSAIDSFPKDVEEALRAVAWRSSRRVKDRARDILNARTGGKADRIAAITIVEDAEHHAFRVIAEGPSDKPANLALWFERGTVHLVARPFMRPAADAEDGVYRSESMLAAEKIADRLGRL